MRTLRSYCFVKEERLDEDSYSIGEIGVEELLVVSKREVNSKSLEARLSNDIDSCLSMILVLEELSIIPLRIYSNANLQVIEHC